MDEYLIEVFDAANILVQHGVVSEESLADEITYYLRDYDRVEVTKV